MLAGFSAVNTVVNTNRLQKNVDELNALRAKVDSRDYVTREEFIIQSDQLDVVLDKVVALDDKITNTTAKLNNALNAISHLSEAEFSFADYCSSIESQFNVTDGSEYILKSIKTRYDFVIKNHDSFMKIYLGEQKSSLISKINEYIDSLTNYAVAKANVDAYAKDHSEVDLNLQGLYESALLALRGSEAFIDPRFKPLLELGYSKSSLCSTVLNFLEGGESATVELFSASLLDHLLDLDGFHSVLGSLLLQLFKLDDYVVGMINPSVSVTNLIGQITSTKVSVSDLLMLTKFSATDFAAEVDSSTFTESLLAKLRSSFDALSLIVSTNKSSFDEAIAALKVQVSNLSSTGNFVPFSLFTSTITSLSTNLSKSVLDYSALAERVNELEEKLAEPDAAQTIGSYSSSNSLSFSVGAIGNPIIPGMEVVVSEAFAYPASGGSTMVKTLFPETFFLREWSNGEYVPQMYSTYFQPFGYKLNLSSATIKFSDGITSHDFAVVSTEFLLVSLKPGETLVIHADPLVLDRMLTSQILGISQGFVEGPSSGSFNMFLGKGALSASAAAEFGGSSVASCLYLDHFNLSITRLADNVMSITKDAHDPLRFSFVVNQGLGSQQVTKTFVHQIPDIGLRSECLFAFNGGGKVYSVVKQRKKSVIER
jgi:BMFP domain-containing protein YqiC